MNDILGVDISEVTPVTEPVTSEEVKAWLRIDSDDDDDIIERLIKSARQAVENYTSCSLIEKTIICNVWLCELFELPYGPVRTITQVSQAENMITDYSKIDGQFVKIYGISGLHKLTYTAGYTNVPNGLKEAILNEVAYRYQNRGDQAKELMIGSAYMCEAAVHLCQPFKRMAWL